MLYQVFPIFLSLVYHFSPSLTFISGFCSFKKQIKNINKQNRNRQSSFKDFNEHPLKV